MRRFLFSVPLLLLASAASAQIPITGRVVDENGAAVPSARVEFHSTEFTVAASSDRAGNFLVTLPAPGDYSIRADRLGFYRFQSKPDTYDGPRELTVVLNHIQEFTDRIDVTASSPAIDPTQPSDHKELDNTEIQTVPYPAQQDYRNALPMNDGIVQDNAARPHVNGARTNQTNYTLDGFNLSDPVTGRLDARLNIDSIQAVDVQTSRFAAENGRGAAGVVGLQTKMGDDRLRFAGTNFIPGISSDGGWHVNKWTPRLEFSGPFAKGRAWFHNGIDLFYSNDTINGLPHDQNRTTGATGSDLSRFQVNLTPANILTGSFLLNLAQTDRFGLSFLTPAETTLTHRQALYLSSIHDQAYLPGGALLDVGFADTRGMVRDLPQGTALFLMTPFGNRGNYFSTTDRHFYREQWIANLFLPTVHLSGTHQLKFGIDFERESFHQQVRRHDYEILRDDGTPARYVTFTGSPFQSRKNFEGAQYIQDAWTPRDGLVIEAGLRAEWNEIVRDFEIEPRIAAAWSPKALGGTKFSAGWGIYYDAIPLDVITQPTDQVSLSTFFLPGGAVQGPITTAFSTSPAGLRTPFSRISSVAVERRLPRDFYLRSGYNHRAGDHAFAFVPQLPIGPPVPPPSVVFQLSNARRERYDGVDISLRHTFAARYEWFIGYTRSATRSDAAVDYSVENPVFAPQMPGPFPWDTPNRVHMWGWAPLPKMGFLTRNTKVSYLAEYRTGFPFSVTTEDGFLMGHPNSWRYPAYFNLNIAFEREFRALHYLWAWRFGFNNVTNNGNPNVVNAVYGTPQFLTYGRGQARAFAVRLRLLGRK